MVRAGLVSHLSTSFDRAPRSAWQRTETPFTLTPLYICRVFLCRYNEASTSAVVAAETAPRHLESSSDPPKPEICQLAHSTPHCSSLPSNPLLSLLPVAMSRVRGDAGLTSELDVLQRKYRSMELHRRDIAEDNTNTLRMQRQQIDKLKKDHERVKEELALETRQAKLNNNISAAQSIAKLQDQGDIYQRKIEGEKRRVHELKAAIGRMEDSILRERKESGGINAARDSNIATTKQIRILENRLDKALVKFNEALAHNKQLRETIDNLRRERVVFDGIYRKLERELADKKVKMAEIIEVSHVSYEQRDAAQAEMYVLQSNAEDQQMMFEKEWSELGELIHKDKLMKQTLQAKEQERSQTLLRQVSATVATTTQPNLSASLSSSGALSATGSGGVVSAGAEEESRLKKKVHRSARTIDKERSSIQLNAEKVASYEEAFALIQKATNISDIEQLVGVFLSAEDENFRLFNFVNQMNGDIEREEDGIERLRQQVDAMKGGEEESVEGVRKQLLSGLSSDLAQYSVQRTNNERSAKDAEALLASLTGGVESVFELLGCDRARARERVGGEAVTESTVGEWLGLVEERVNELCAMYEQQLGEQSEDSRQKQRQLMVAQADEADDAADGSATQQQLSASGEQSVEENADEKEPEDNDAAAMDAAQPTGQQTAGVDQLQQNQVEQPAAAE